MKLSLVACAVRALCHVRKTPEYIFGSGDWMWRIDSPRGSPLVAPWR